MKVYVQAILLLVVFWNVENFFEDKPYFTRKCNGIAKTVFKIADRYSAMPDVIALAEVGNRDVLVKLLYRTSLSKFGYGIVHYDSPDRRGIDCALLYRKSSVKVSGSRPCHITDSAGNIVRTRDILLVETDSVAFLVNHHPSKIGKDSEYTRRLAMERMTSICDSLEAEGRREILCVGDFNDTLWGKSAKGTIKYNGCWQKIDGYFERGLIVSEEVFDAPHLSGEDRRFGGLKPLRTFSGPRYLGGISDHYPIVLEVMSERDAEKKAECRFPGK